MAPELLIFDLKIGFYVKFPPWGRVPRSQFWHGAQKLKNCRKASGATTVSLQSHISSTRAWLVNQLLEFVQVTFVHFFYRVLGSTAKNTVYSSFLSLTVEKTISYYYLLSLLVPIISYYSFFSSVRRVFITISYYYYSCYYFLLFPIIPIYSFFWVLEGNRAKFWKSP